MREIHLHGALGKEFGGPFSLDVETPAEAVRALASQMPGFAERIEDGEWELYRGDNAMNLEELQMLAGRARSIHIHPAAVGAGDSGAGKIVAGAALIGAAYFTGGASLGALSISAGTMGAMGASLALSGISMALTKTPNATYEDKPEVDERPSYLYDGPVNNSAQGLAVPIIIGEVHAGSIVVSEGLTAEKMDV